MRVEPLSIQTRDRPQWAGAYRMQDIEIFVQAEGRHTISLIQVKQDAATEALAAAAIVQEAYPVADGHAYLVSLEEADELLTPGVMPTTAGTGHRSRVHLPRCRKIQVTVSFNGQEKSRAFSPAATIGRVTQWAVGKRSFDLDDIDAAEHVCRSLVFWRAMLTAITSRSITSESAPLTARRFEGRVCHGLAPRVVYGKRCATRVRRADGSILQTEVESVKSSLSRQP
jgi:hypothetical protein